MPKFQFRLRTLFLVMFLLSIPLTVWHLLRTSGLAYPYDAAHLHLDCGARDLSDIAVVAHCEGGDFGLRPYHWKVYYFKGSQPGLSRIYTGGAVTSDTEWIDAPRYSVIAKDAAKSWREWRVSPDDLKISGTLLPSGRTVSITIPMTAAEAQPDAEYLTRLGISVRDQ